MKKHWLYSLFHTRRDDLPDLEEEDTRPTLKRFFKLLGRKFWKLISLNIMMWPMLAPILLAAFFYIGIDKTPSGNSVIFPQLYGAYLIEQSTDTAFLLDLFGAQFLIPAYHSTGTYVAIGACVLFLFVTFGWQNIGTTYILRSLVRGDPVFLLSDYTYAVRRNWKQGLFLGMLDFVILFLLGFDFMFFWGNPSSFWNDCMLFAIAGLGILYFFMRFYIYLLQITFQLSIRKILKNALIFTTLGVRRNLMAVLGILLLSAIAIAFVALFASISASLIGIPLIFPVLYYQAFTAFMCAYAAWPIIDRYMIAPFQHGEEEEDEADEAENGGEGTALPSPDAK